jgi:hypothetical protein
MTVLFVMMKYGERREDLRVELMQFGDLRMIDEPASS